MKTGPVIVMFAALLPLGGCEQPRVPADPLTYDEADVVARVNGAPITKYDVAWWLRSAHTEEMTPALKKGAIDRLVEGELVYQQGLELGLHEQADYRKAVRELEVQLKATRRGEMMKRVYNQQVAADIEVSAESVRQYFEDNRTRFQRELTLGVLSFDTVADARSAKAQLERGELFEDLAEAFGGDWQFGPLSWARIPLEWHDVVYALERGETSDVLEGERTGIRLFKLIDTTAREDVEFSDVETSISRRLRDERTRQAFKAYVARLKREANITRHD